ncbi:MAG: hypothetical protein JOZ15_07010, partial [Acidobacteria bacterium]|nr:hypothetical protein [Acidobacteriota bacterium]
MPSSAETAAAAADIAWLRRALRLAARGRYRTSPNPMVGALVVGAGGAAGAGGPGGPGGDGGHLLGSGWHRRVGGPHAEVEALAAVAAAGEQARGATLYVTLE